VQLGTDQPRVSEIKRDRLDRFSLETLIRFATRLRCDVELRVTNRPIAQRTEHGGDRSR
jgi:predicted XRE-type DNA-binding protein